MNTSTALTAPVQNSALSLLMDPARFDHLQRVGKMLALSPLFPEHLRKGGIEAAIANGALVLNMAHRLNEDPLTVAQNIYFVGGRPGWNTTYMIGKANQAGVFRDPIDWDIKGKGDTLTVTAFGILARTGKRVEVTLDWSTAVKEGWTKNPKYQSIPEQMFRYRTAAFLIRLYCPEVMIGIPLAVERELPEMRDVTPDDGPQVIMPRMQDAPVEGKAAPATTTPPKTEAKPSAAIQPAAKAEPDPEKEPDKKPETHDPETGEVSADPGTSVDEERFERLFEMIVSDLQESGRRTVEELYGAQIEQIKASAPELFKRLQVEMAKAPD